MPMYINSIAVNNRAKEEKLSAGSSHGLTRNQTLKVSEIWLSDPLENKWSFRYLKNEKSCVVLAFFVKKNKRAPVFFCVSSIKFV